MHPPIELKRYGQLARHDLLSDLRSILGVDVVGAVQDLLPTIAGNAIQSAVEQAIADTVWPTVQFDGIDPLAWDAFRQSVWPALRDEIRQEGMSLNAWQIAYIRRTLLPLSYYDISAEAVQRIITDHVAPIIPRIVMEPVQTLDDDDNEFAISHAFTAAGGERVIEYSATTGRVHIPAPLLSLGEGAELSSASRTQLAIGRATLDWSRPQTLALGVDDTCVLTASPDACNILAPLAVSGAVACIADDAGNAGSGRVTIFPGTAPVGATGQVATNVVESRGNLSFRCTAANRHSQPLMLTGPHVLVNAGTNGPTGDVAMEVWGGGRVDRLTCESATVGVLQCGAIVGEGGVPLLPAPRSQHVRVAVAPSPATQHITVPHTMGPGAVVHVTFVGTGSASIRRVGNLSMDALVNAPAGGELMVSAFTPS